MVKKKTVLLDLTDCRYLGELHERIRIAFDFPEWYGANLSAFDDLLGTDCNADEIVISGISTLEKDIADYWQKLKLILDDTVNERKYYSNLYSHIKPLVYRIEN